MKRQDRIPEVYYYEWSISRWRSSRTRAQLTPAGRGIYREILDLCYSQGSIPKDLQTLASMAGCAPVELEQIWPIISRHFVGHKTDKNSLTNKTADVVRRNYFAFIGTQKRNGQNGGKHKANVVSNISSDGVSQRARVKLRQAESSVAESSVAEATREARSQWPLTSQAIRESAPATDDPFVERIAAAAAAAFAGIQKPKAQFSDGFLAAAVRACKRDSQKSAGLFLNTVPECVRTWATDGQPAPPRDALRSDLPSWKGHAEQKA